MRFLQARVIQQDVTLLHEMVHVAPNSCPSNDPISLKKDAIKCCMESNRFNSCNISMRQILIILVVLHVQRRSFTNAADAWRKSGRVYFFFLQIVGVLDKLTRTLTVAILQFVMAWTYQYTYHTVCNLMPEEPLLRTKQIFLVYRLVEIQTSLRGLEF